MIIRCWGEINLDLDLGLVNKFYEEGKVQNDDAQFVCEIRMDELKVLKQGFGWLMNG